MRMNEFYRNIYEFKMYILTISTSDLHNLLEALRFKGTREKRYDNYFQCSQTAFFTFESSFK